MFQFSKKGFLTVLLTLAACAHQPKVLSQEAFDFSGEWSNGTDTYDISCTENTRTIKKVSDSDYVPADSLVTITVITNENVDGPCSGFQGMETIFIIPYGSRGNIVPREQKVNFPGEGIFYMNGEYFNQEDSGGIFN